MVNTEGFRANRYDRIAEIAKLKDGWLDGEGKAISPRAVHEAKILVDAWLSQNFGIYPTPNGNICFEWSNAEHDTFVSIEVGLDTDALEIYEYTKRKED